MTENRTFGEIYFEKIDENEYLNSLYERVLYYYALKVFKYEGRISTDIPIKDVLRFADILSKSLGSNTKINMAYATLNALKAQKTVEEVALLRGKKVEEII